MNMEDTALTLVPRIKQQLAHAREQLRYQTPNREVISAHIDTAEAMLDALFAVIPVEVPNTLKPR